MKKILLIVLLVVMTGCGITGNATVEDTIKVGVIGTLTGYGAYYGEQEVKGILLARDEINSAGGIDGKLIELVVEDSQSSPAVSITALQKLISVDNVQYVIGDSWTSTTVAMVPVANENEVILISPIAILDNLGEFEYFFRTIPNTKFRIPFQY